MSLRLPRTGSARRTAVAGLALGLPLALAGCGANFEAQTYQERTVADGTNTAKGAIAVRNVNVLPPREGSVHEAGEDVLVGFALTNDGPEDDRLVEISSPAASSVRLVRGDDLDEVEDVELPRLGTVGTQYAAVLEGLTEEVMTGQYVEVTFLFERNGSVTVQAPVATTGENDQEERERSENFHVPGEEGEEH